MKKSSLLFIFILVLLTMVSCKKNIELPKTIEEVEQIMSSVPESIYDIDDLSETEFEDQESVPEGAEISVIAYANGDFFIGVRFIDEDSLKKGYDKLVILIKENLKSEFNQDESSYTIYDNDCWIYAGSKTFISVFEGKNK